ncbi:MAG: thioredoxin domain-containing protein, partial [Deltaproteobacteria bacterium]|nr:thioredoxin domain-containing protein [Deltaproteobacteria bacterium]
LVPHFEKMLYDNALLATTYLEAAQVLQDPLYRGVARGTLEYLLRDMRSPEGAFYTAEDAGEVGKEGEFYVWTEAELAKLLPSDQFAALKAAYPVSGEGNFEQGQNILTLNSGIEWQRRDSGLVQQALQTIFEARTKRTRPHLDDKVLSGWNGLAITALCKGFQVLRDSRYLAAAQECAHFIRRAMTTPDELLRRYRAGEAKFSAGLEEYAYVIEGLLNLYACDFDERWLLWAKELQSWQDRKLWDVERGGYFFSDSPELLQRRKEYIDGATPSGNSVAALNCLRLYAFFGELEYLRRAEFILKAASGGLARYPTAFPKALQALDTMLAGPREIAIVRGSKDQLGKQLCDFLFESFLPHAVWMLVDAESASASALPLLRDRVSLQGRTTVYVCQKQTCGLPLTDFDEVQAAITRGEPA